MEKTGCKIICGAPTTLAVKGWMMMMMNEKTDFSIGHVTDKPDIPHTTNDETDSRRRLVTTTCISETNSQEAVTQPATWSEWEDCL